MDGDGDFPGIWNQVDRVVAFTPQDGNAGVRVERAGQGESPAGDLGGVYGVSLYVDKVNYIDRIGNVAGDDGFSGISGAESKGRGKAKDEFFHNLRSVVIFKDICCGVQR